MEHYSIYRTAITCACVIATSSLTMLYQVLKPANCTKTIYPVFIAATHIVHDNE
jgi:hypothetical protein